MTTAISESKTILLVEDQPDNLQIIVDIFQEEEEFFNILKATNGEDALNILKNTLPDIIITDWEMPVMNGIEFIRELKKNEDTSDIPVIICSGSMTSSDNLNTALNEGAIDYLRKPIDKIELLARTKASLHLAQKYKEIKRLSHTKDRFFSIIAHELRGPFSSILGLVDLIKIRCQTCDQDKAEQYLSNISLSAKNAFELLENLLNWASSQSGHLNYNPQNHSLNQAISKSIELSKSIANAKEINIKIRNESDHNVFVDIDMINTVVRNLLSNAIKFTHPYGNIEVAYTRKEDMLEVSVLDDGVGMKEETINQLFRIDKKVKGIGTNNERGTGLGLLLCKEFVNLHKGRIWANSELNKGSQFVFTIPLC